MQVQSRITVTGCEIHGLFIVPVQGSLCWNSNANMNGDNFGWHGRRHKISHSLPLTVLHPVLS